MKRRFLHFVRAEGVVFNGGASVAVVRSEVNGFLMRGFHGRVHGIRAGQNKVKANTTNKGTKIVKETKTRRLHRP
jgi:hypothetical protein